MKCSEPRAGAIRLLAAVSMLLVGGEALAHHVSGGAPPAGAWEGLLSGLGHPLIEWQHALFLLGIGVLAAVRPGARLALPVAFLAAAAAGFVGHWLYGHVAVSLLVLPFTVLAVAALLVVRPDARGRALMLLMLLAGLCHGHAYAADIAGATLVPALAFAAGLAVVQPLIIALVSIGVAHMVRFSPERPMLPARVAGAGMTSASAVALLLVY